MSLILSCKWNAIAHGWEDIEERFIHFMQFKHMVYYRIDMENETISDIIEFIENNTDISENIQLKISKSIYYYRNRMFAILNFGIERLQRKYKTYYAKKMAYYKNPRNLRNREITGKFQNY